eukprot:TRINITY_DN10402_c0_g1_i1.p1 TRINITY_DN10402_c0_g1~~TRINITY_DN10402_c0_g1_i1.p1  ORF type:complete len:580 (-),score=204.50 TRINITY_DN10402_c0_g1_i1:170-1807(-)
MALSSEAWSATSTLKNEIARATFHYQGYKEVMTILWDKLATTKEWRIVYKSLELLEFLLRNGGDQIADDAKDHIYTLRPFLEYSSMEGDRDSGNGVRAMAKTVLDFLNNSSKLEAERKKAQQLKDRFTSMGSETVSSSKYDSYSSERPYDSYSSTQSSIDTRSYSNTSSFDSSSSYASSSSSTKKTAKKKVEKEEEEDISEEELSEGDIEDDEGGEDEQAKKKPSKSKSGKKVTVKMSSGSSKPASKSSVVLSAPNEASSPSTSTAQLTVTAPRSTTTATVATTPTTNTEIDLLQFFTPTTSFPTVAPSNSTVSTLNASFSGLNLTNTNTSTNDNFTVCFPKTSSTTLYSAPSSTTTSTSVSSSSGFDFNPRFVSANTQSSSTTQILTSTSPNADWNPFASSSSSAPVPSSSATASSSSSSSSSSSGDFDFTGFQTAKKPEVKKQKDACWDSGLVNLSFKSSTDTSKTSASSSATKSSTVVPMRMSGSSLLFTPSTSISSAPPMMPLYSMYNVNPMVNMNNNMFVTQQPRTQQQPKTNSNDMFFS